MRRMTRNRRQGETIVAINELMKRVSSWRLAHRLHHVIVCIAVTLLAALPSVASADVAYTYDEAGRLVGVYAPNGDAAQYVYDAAGNISSINRFPAGTLAIIEFTPNAG